MLLVFAFTVSWLALKYRSNGAGISFLLRVQKKHVIGKSRFPLCKHQRAHREVRSCLDLMDNTTLNQAAWQGYVRPLAEPEM
ncbi:rCG55945 [Rattus norvegicus]|uniref:RCG55945 n=1 Tax=Rattus norvegicus TaxID=10116 RepID=A6JM72_RAT|nr:rCG55945 [Rattus norvegicus]